MDMEKFLSFFLLLFSSEFMPTASTVSSQKGAVTKSIFVGTQGLVDFSTVQSAIDSITAGNSDWIRIHVSSGIYKEQVRISKDKGFVFLEGEGRDATTIVSSNALPIYNDTKGGNKIPMDSVATFISFADNIVVKDMTFKNLYTEDSGLVKRAIAAYIDGDKTSLYGCGFISYQDTLFDWVGRHYFENCYIEGAIDYIFGTGQSIYENCTIFTIANKQNGSAGWITAQGREGGNDENGFVFKFCNLVGTGKAYLGRAWGAYSRVVFFKSTMSEVVDPRGWDKWKQQGENICFFEYQCTGPGSTSTGRVDWMKKTLGGGNYIDVSGGNGYIDKEGWLEQQP